MIFFVILIILACVILGLIILIQNPKGGGLAGNVGGFSNQLMGVKQTTDVLEKGTWVLAVVVGLLCLFSTIFVPKVASSNTRIPEKVNATGVPRQQSAPAAPTTVPASAPAPLPGKP
jgi:preprotein translocase subunit SecG